MPTIAEIARAAGVSVGTVSNVLNDRPCVAEETRARVLAVMRRLHYRPSAPARSLASRRSRTIGLIVSNIANPFFSELAQGAIEAARALGVSLLVAGAAHDASDVPQHINTLLEQWVDGIFLAAQPLPPEVLAGLRFGNTPLVVMDGGPQLPAAALGSIGFDWRQASYLATRHLLQLGHRRIGYIGGIPGRWTSTLRLEGFHQALAERGLAEDGALVVEGDFLAEGGYAAARRLLACQDYPAGGRGNPQHSAQVSRGTAPAVRPTAILAANDLMALGALRAAHELGLRVPQDLALAGIDDIPFAALTSPPLTTVRVPVRELGRLGVEMLCEGRGDAPREVTLPVDLVVRGSTGKVGR
jgi:LacI family transcriptional regulator